MSLTFFIFILCLIVGLNIFAIVILCKFKSKHANAFINFIIVTVMAFLLYFSSIVISNEEVMKVLYCLYLSFMVVSSFLLFRYISLYTNTKINKVLFYFLLILTLVDFTIEIVNIFYPVSTIFTYEVTSSYILIHPKGNVIYLIHLIYSYLLIILSLLLLFIKYKKSSKIHRFEYVYMLVFLLTIIIINILFIVGVFKINVSTALYAIFTFVTTLYTYVYVPMYLENLTSCFMIKDVASAYILFDNIGVLISENYNSKVWFNSPTLDKILEYNKALNTEITFKCFDGITRLFVVSQNTLYSKDKQHEELGTYFIARDVTKERIELAKREYNANHDSLTGLYTEHHFIEMVSKRLKNSKDKYSIAVFEINHYSLYVNLFGEEVAKSLIKTFANYLDSKIKRNSSIYAILGESRFVLFDYYEIINDYFYLNSENIGPISYKNFEINTNIGIYEIDDRNEDVKLMINKAIIALKDINKHNKSMIYNSKISERIEKENKLIQMFPEALDNGMIDIFIQPQINTPNNKLVGGEALVRWHYNNKVISPGEFLPILLKEGLITKLDQYVWEKAIKFSKELLDLGYPTPISINITAQDLFSIDINEYINNLLDKYNLDSKYLNIEITENEMMNDLDYALEVISKFKKRGIKIEMDDFGSAYSSLNSLKNIPVDLIKLDLKFLNNSGDCDKKDVIIESMLELARRLNLPLIAEGVEEKHQLESLNKIGCRYVQGYYYSKPISKDEFIEYRKKNGIDIILKPNER